MDLMSVELCMDSNSATQYRTCLGSHKLLLQEPGDFPKIYFVVGKNQNLAPQKIINQNHANLIGFLHVQPVRTSLNSH